jgi:hypothetical protein
MSMNEVTIASDSGGGYDNPMLMMVGMGDGKQI